MTRNQLFAPLLAAIITVFSLPALAEVKIKEVVTPGGLNAWLVEDHSIPFVALELRFRGGASLDQSGKRGATNLMVGLLEEGTGELDARGFARAVEGIAADFDYDLYDDAISISAKFLTETQDEAMELLKGSIDAPNFEDAAIERVRAQVISIIKSDALDPQVIARDAFTQLVFGDHPYGSSEYGTVESVSALTRDDLVEAHRSAFSRERLYISAVGDITEAQLSDLIDGLLGDLPKVGPPLAGDALVNLPGGVVVVDYETPQSTAIFAQPGIDRDHPDFFAAFILNHILGGGGFESRLMSEVREKRGLTYGISSYLSDKDGAQIWMGSVSSSNNSISEAIDVVKSEWTKLRDEGVTEAELVAAKTYITGAYPLRFDGNGPIANIAVGMQYNGLPVDYIATRNDRMNAVKLEDVNRVARELIDPERLTFVVVGQPENLNSTVN